MQTVKTKWEKDRKYVGWKYTQAERMTFKVYNNQSPCGLKY